MGLACCKDEIKNDQDSSTKFGTRKILTTTINSQRQQQSTQFVTKSINLKQSQGKEGLIRNGFLAPETIDTQKCDTPRRSPENYQSIKYLGKGIFGDVVLAQDKQTGHQYAMKIIEKKKIKQFNVIQSSIIKIISQKVAEIREKHRNKRFLVMPNTNPSKCLRLEERYEQFMPFLFCDPANKNFLFNEIFHEYRMIKINNFDPH